MSDLEPDIIAEVDQMIRGFKEQARLFYSYYREMVTHGFTEQQAWDLTLAFQQSLFRGNHSE